MTVPAYGVPPHGYRLPESTRLGRVRLQVADLERSLAYYERVLGFGVRARAPHDATLAAQSDDTPLIELHERAGAAPARRPTRLGLYHFAILLPDRAALGRFAAHLARLGVRFGASDHVVSEALYLQDPDGLGIEVYADRPRDAWRRNGQELAMDTTPLDLADLGRAGGGESFTGMPSGTVVGHVHLHVGALDEAASFYHAALGLDAMVWSYPGALFLAAGGYHHHLGVNTWAGPDARPAGDDDAHLLEWQIVLPSAEDVEGAARSLEAARYPVARDDAGFSAVDPWGTRVRVTAASSAAPR